MIINNIYTKNGRILTDIESEKIEPNIYRIYYQIEIIGIFSKTENKFLEKKADYDFFIKYFKNNEEREEYWENIYNNLSEEEIQARESYKKIKEVQEENKKQKKLLLEARKKWVWKGVNRNIDWDEYDKLY